MSDETRNEVENEELKFEDGEAEVEFIHPALKVEHKEIPVDPDEGLPEEHRGKTKEELIAEMEAMRREREELAQRGDSAKALSESVDRLGEKLSRPVSKPSGSEAYNKWLEDYKAREASLRKEIKENFLDDPDGLLDRFQQLKMEPVTQQLLARNMPVYRNLAELDPELGQVMRDYGAEVDAEVNGLPPGAQLDPNVYKSAAKRVRANHFQELVEAEARKIVEKQAQEAGTGGGTVTAGVVSNPRPNRKPSKPKLTAEEKAECFKRGIEETDFLRWNYGWEE
jgi:hypothetical protein